MQITVHLQHPSIPCWTFSEANRARLQQHLPQATIHHAASRDEFLQHLPETEFALTWSFKQDWFALAPRLKAIATPAAGRDYFHIDLPEHVRLWNGAFHGPLMAQTALGMMLAATRGILDLMRVPATTPWPRAEIGTSMRSLAGSHLVILGFGRIGQWIGRYAKPFGLRITGIRRSAMPRPAYFCEGDQVRTVEDLEEILPHADHLVLVLPSDTGTDCILNETRLAILPPSACIYNLGRGNAIDEAALVRWARRDRTGWICLDVFAHEPLPADSPLRDLERVLLMPHASAVSPDYLDRFVDEVAERIQGLCT